MNDAKYVVSSTPHVRDKVTTQGIMIDVIIALCPAAIMGIYYFGFDALFTIALSIASCVFFEYLFKKISNRAMSIKDCSAIVTGLLLAMNLPASKNLLLPIIGSAFGIIFVKQIFGGLGYNFLNPALGARVFLLLSYPTAMVNFPAPQRNFMNLGVDAVSSATPLAALKSGVAPASSDYINALIGYHGGCLGEVCAAALILGGIYLFAKRIITWRIPASFLGTVFVLTFIFGRGANAYPIYEILTGGVLIGALFMATDYTTSPVTPVGQIIMGIGCGLITTLIRIYGSYPEGVSFAILFMNLATPLIDKFTPPRVMGKKRQKVKIS